MATIAFLMEHEEGHLLPTFHLARRLAARGHRVLYLGLVDGADFVRRQGFEYLPILEDLVPRGTLRTVRGASQEGGGGSALPEVSWFDLYERYLGALVRGALDEVVRTVRPDLFLASLFHGANTMAVHYRYGRPIVLITPFLRTRPKADFAQAIANTLTDLRGGMDELMQLVRRTVPSARRLSDVTAPFLRLRELILCPVDLEIPGEDHAREPDVHYTEASVDLERREDGEFPFDRLDPDRRLLFASFGSQAQVYGRERALRLVDAALKAVASRPDWQLVLTAGGLRQEELPPLPANAVVVPWAPQLALLRRAAVAITMGGSGPPRSASSTVFPWWSCRRSTISPTTRAGSRITASGCGATSTPSPPKA